MTIWFDMDGTIANLYAVESWLEKLRASDASPYRQAAVMLNMNKLARKLNALQKAGYEIGIISWLSKVTTEEYSIAVTEAKTSWLAQHLHSVHWNYVRIVEYGTPKAMFAKTDEDILFDDEEKNRNEWQGKSYSPEEIFEILEAL